MVGRYDQRIQFLKWAFGNNISLYALDDSRKIDIEESLKFYSEWSAQDVVVTPMFEAYYVSEDDYILIKLAFGHLSPQSIFLTRVT